MRILLHLFLFVIPYLCQEETELQCSAKPGCQIAQCDQAPLDWTKPGFNVNEHLQRNKFPITCVIKNAGKSQQNSGNLFPLIIGNVQAIQNVESNLKKIQRKVDDNAFNIKGITTSGKIVSKQATETQELRDENKKKSFEISDLREVNDKQSMEIEKQSNEIKKQFKEIKELRSKIAEQSTEVEELRKENAEINIEIKEMKKENNEQSYLIKKILDQMQKILSGTKTVDEEDNNKKTKELTGRKFRQTKGPRNSLDLSTWYKAKNGNYYKLSDDTANYATAKANCERYGARLASAGIRDNDVRRQLIPLLEEGDFNTWIGLNDIEREGTFYWVDGVRGSSILWAKNQPNNYEGNQDCVKIGPSRNWKLNDENCSDSNKYLCEIAI